MNLKLIKDFIGIKEATNPFVIRKRESGLILLPGSSGLAMSNETGQLEMMEQIIGFGIVNLVGPDCKIVKLGDGVYYDRRTPQPVPFNEGTWVLNENQIRAYVEDDNGSIAKAVADGEEEQAAEARRTELSKNMQANAGKGILGII